MDGFGLGGIWGGGGCGGSGDPLALAMYAGLGAPAQPSGVVCPPQAMNAIDPCDPRTIAMVQELRAAEAYALAGARRGIIAQARAGQPAVPVGIGTPGVAGATLVPANSAATFQVTPYNGNDYCFVDLDVSRSQGAPFFLIMSITIGQWTPFTDTTGVPADTLAPDAIHPLLDLGATTCNGTFSITVFNTDSSPQRFNATLWGIPRYRRSGGPCL